VPWLGAPLTVSRVVLSGPDVRLDIFRLYWVNGRVTASEYVAKWLIAWSKITGQGDDSALIVFYTPIAARGEEANAILRDFAAANSPTIDSALAAARRGPG
jgi:EpsI family protein